MGCTPPALCTLCIDVCSGAQVVSPSGHDVLTVPDKQAVTVPPDARCTARHLKVLREALTAPRCTSGADPGEQVVEQSHQPAVQGDALHHWSSGSTTLPPCSAAGALDVPRLSACLRDRPCPEGAPGGTFGSIAQDWDMISKIRARQSTRNRLVLTLGWTDERRRRTCEQQVFHRKVLRSNRVSPEYATRRHTLHIL